MFNNLIPTIKYMLVTLQHKAYVFRAGLWSKAPLWNLVIHDWTKFTPSEAPYYGRQLHGDRGDNIGFIQAWNHHQNSSKHHWEWWIPHSGHIRGDWPDGVPLPMPEKYVREMVADWFGASRQFTGSYPESMANWVWWEKNEERIKLHPDTKALLLKVLRETFAAKNGN